MLASVLLSAGSARPRPSSWLAGPQKTGVYAFSVSVTDNKMCAGRRRAGWGHCVSTLDFSFMNVKISRLKCEPAPRESERRFKHKRRKLHTQQKEVLTLRSQGSYTCFCLPHLLLRSCRKPQCLGHMSKVYSWCPGPSWIRWPLLPTFSSIKWERSSDEKDLAVDYVSKE